MNLHLRSDQNKKLSVFFYHIFIVLFQVSMRLASWFNPKAAKWVNGRKHLFQKLKASIAPTDRIIWMHCASLGEFEQGRPLLEALKNKYPSHRILLTFFSPSGYEIQREYSGADWISYLPMDGPRNAGRFLDIVHPELVIFVKYEFWFFYLKKLHYRKIPLLLVAALFRNDMAFFSWYGQLSRKMASRFQKIFVQNQSSWQLLEKIGLGRIAVVAGDTRFERVVAIADQALPVQEILDFAHGAPLLIAGSTWPADEKALSHMMAQKNLPGLKLVVAPHEISEPHLKEIEDLFPLSVRLSAFHHPLGKNANVLIIDNYGLLSRAYRHATIAYVGGGLQKAGIHNVLEAAVYGVPVVFGPRYKKYAEAVDLVEQGGAWPLREHDPPEISLELFLKNMLDNENIRFRMGAAAKEFVYKHQGATRIILHHIQTVLK